MLAPPGPTCTAVSSPSASLSLLPRILAGLVADDAMIGMSTVSSSTIRPQDEAGASVTE